MKLFLDDFRIPGPGWRHVRTAPEAIALLEAGGVEEISLDYDLGDCRDDLAFTGWAVAKWLARYARGGGKRIAWHLHSDHIEGREKILRMMERAETCWLESEMHDREPTH